MPTTKITTTAEGETIAIRGGFSRDPLRHHEAEAIGQLAATIGDLATAMRAVACQHSLTSVHTREPAQSARDSLSAFDALTEPEDGGAAEPGTETVTREAVSGLSHVAELLVTALECIASGKAVASSAVLGPMLMADAKLTEVIRLVPEEEFKATVKALWGREAMPQRIR